MTKNKFHSDHEEALRYKSTTLQSWPVQQHPPRDTSIMLSWHSFIMCLSCVFYKGLSTLHCCDYDQLIIARINNSTAAASSSWSINPWMDIHCMLKVYACYRFIVYGVHIHRVCVRNIALCHWIMKYAATVHVWWCMIVMILIDDACNSCCRYSYMLHMTSKWCPLHLLSINNASHQDVLLIYDVFR